MTNQQCHADGCYCPNTFQREEMQLCMIHLDYYENGVPFRLKEEIDLKIND